MAKARRGRGEGAIFQRDDGLWVTTISQGYDDKGKRRRRTLYGKTKREIQDKLLKLQTEAASGITLQPQKFTMASYLDYWLTDVARPTIKDGTFFCYEKIIRLHIVPYLGNTPLAKVVPVVIQGLYAELERRGASPRMRQLVHAVLHRAFGQAIKLEMLSRNPCDAVDKPRVSAKPMKYLSPEQVEQLLEVTKEHRLHALFMLAISTGLRQGELLGLYWEHVDLKAGTISVVQNLAENKGVFKIDSTKSDKPRIVTLPSYAIQAMREHRVKMLAEGNLKQMVFPSEVGTPIFKRNLLRDYKILLKKAGLPEIRFHDLRHTAATLLLQQGAHMKVVQERLGHANFNLTANTYSHVSPALQQDAADRLEFYNFGGKSSS